MYRGSKTRRRLVAGTWLAVVAMMSRDPSALPDASQATATAVASADGAASAVLDVAGKAIPRLGVQASTAQQGSVPPKKVGALPIADSPLTVAVIGGPGTLGPVRAAFLFAPSPFAEPQKVQPRAQFEFDPGYTPEEASSSGRRSDPAIGFGIRYPGPVGSDARGAEGPLAARGFGR